MGGRGGANIRIRGGGGGRWSFLEINIFVGKMGEINKWHGGNKYLIQKGSGNIYNINIERNISGLS